MVFFFWIYEFVCSFFDVWMGFFVMEYICVLYIEMKLEKLLLIIF